MTNMKKLMMFAVAGLLAPAAAHAEIRTATVSKIMAAPTNDTAPVTGTPARLRRTDSEQAGHEQATFAMFGDGKTGLYFDMATEINGQPANHRVQLGLVPFTLVKNTDGSIAATANMTAAKFVTNNDGDEYRNSHNPEAFALPGGQLIAVAYNYQPQGTNDTKRYMQVFNSAGVAVMPQTLYFAKNNDDCSMDMDKASSSVADLGGGKYRIVSWNGCNGNGSDDGWTVIKELTCDAAATSCTLKAIADVSVCPREERSHGTAQILSTDPNTAIVAWTEGNTQPQRDGTWMAAINVGAGQNGANAQSRILWKKQIDGRKDIDGIRTYSMRAMMTPVLSVDATGKVATSDTFIWRSGDLRGDNNGNNGKGGTYYRSQMAVIKANKDGMSYVAPLTDVAPKLLGLDGTHLGMAPALFGTTDHLVPGITFLSGSHTGGGYSAQVRAVTFDAATNTFADGGMYGIAPYDRHLYPNYLGNNPGNQGRNFSNGKMIANPFASAAGDDAYLMLFATNGKDPADMTKPELKLSAYITVLPIAQTPKAVTPDPTPTDPGTGSGSSTPNPDPGAGGNDSGSALGGCSAGGSTGGLATFLLIGLAAFIRRRR